MTAVIDNPMGTRGFAFLEFALPNSQQTRSDLNTFGFTKAGHHQHKKIDYYRQSDIHFFMNEQENSHAAQFATAHGASVSAMGFRVNDANHAFERALKQGARAYEGKEGEAAFSLPVIYGIGDSLLYFVDDANEKILYQQQINITEAFDKQSQNLTCIDHVTHNLYRGNMSQWANFYEKIFNFHEVRYFDIKGRLTGLISKAMTSPCGKIRIPLNESTDDKSQIEEYLREYKGEGIQHIALASTNIYETVEALRARDVKFLTVPDAYYKMLENRLPGHTEDLDRLFKNKILVDGDTSKQPHSLLLQLFTPNMIGPVFFEIIQRKGNEGFGEGNFKALFESMEQDQIDRGVL